LIDLVGFFAQLQYVILKILFVLIKLQRAYAVVAHGLVKFNKLCTYI